MEGRDPDQPRSSRARPNNRDDDGSAEPSMKAARRQALTHVAWAWHWWRRRVLGRPCPAEVAPVRRPPASRPQLAFLKPRLDDLDRADRSSKRAGRCCAGRFPPTPAACRAEMAGAACGFARAACRDELLDHGLKSQMGLACSRATACFQGLAPDWYGHGWWRLPAVRSSLIESLTVMRLVPSRW